jgi:broad specificity phosphatase PhoE
MGQSDIPLNDTGRAQAQVLSQKLLGCLFASLYTSDLKRARETAETIAAVLHVPVTSDPRLREINQGEWEGQLVDIIKARYADLWQQRSVDPAKIRPPGGETVGEVAERVQHVLDDIAHIHPEDSILIVSHGLALATVICKVRGIPVGQAYHVIPENADPVWVEWEKN